MFESLVKKFTNIDINNKNKVNSLSSSSSSSSTNDKFKQITFKIINNNETMNQDDIQREHQQHVYEEIKENYYCQIDCTYINDNNNQKTTTTINNDNNNNDTTIILSSKPLVINTTTTSTCSNSPTNISTTSSQSSSTNLSLLVSTNIDDSSSSSQNNHVHQRPSIKRVRFDQQQQLQQQQQQQQPSFTSFFPFSKPKSNINVTSIELKQLSNINTTTAHVEVKYNSILKKSKSNQNTIRSSCSDGDTPLCSSISSSSSSSDRNSTSSSDNFLHDVNCQNHIYQEHCSIDQEYEFDDIIEEFVCRLMCKTKGNNRCQLCNKYRNKSFFSSNSDEKKRPQPSTNSMPRLQQQQQQPQVDHQQQRTLPTNTKLDQFKRNIDDRLSFRVTNLTIQDLKNRKSNGLACNFPINDK